MAILFVGWSVVVFGCLVWAIIAGTARAIPWRIVALLGLLVPLLATIAAVRRDFSLAASFKRFRADLINDPSASQHRSVGAETGDLLQAPSPIGSIHEVGLQIARQGAQLLLLLGVVIAVVVALALVVYNDQQLSELLPIDFGQLAALHNPFGSVSELALSSPAFWQLFVGLAAQWIFVSIAVLTPAAMYFQFDRQRLSAIKHAWTQKCVSSRPGNAHKSPTLRESTGPR
jgi:hypothetical protein